MTHAAGATRVLVDASPGVDALGAGLRAARVRVEPVDGSLEGHAARRGGDRSVSHVPDHCVDEMAGVRAVLDGGAPPAALVAPAGR